MGEQHAKYSPSKLPRIILCPGSGLEESSSDDAASNIYADEGTMLHLVTSECLDERRFVVAQQRSNKFKLNAEQIDVVEDCLTVAYNLQTTHFDDLKMYDKVETRVSLKGFVEATDCAELEDVEGTLDYAVVAPTQRVLNIIDWKFGAGIPVYPDSDQIKAYALGQLKNPTIMQDFDVVRLIIMQPRINIEPLVHETTPAELFNWLKDTLVPALLSIKAKHPIYNPSEKACRWCPIKATCEARRKFVLDTAVAVFSTHAKLPKFNEQELIDLLDKEDAVVSCFKDIRAFIAARITSGKGFAGYKMVHGRSSRDWVDEKAARDWLTEKGLMRKDLYTEKFVSPAQAEKLLRRPWKKDTEFTKLFVKSEGKHTLVKESDPREAIPFKSPVEVFKDVLIK